MAVIYFEMHQSKMDREMERNVIKSVLCGKILDSMSADFCHKFCHCAVCLKFFNKTLGQNAL